MRVLMRAAVGLSLLFLAGCLESPPLHQSVNEPGQRVTLQPLLARGKTNVIHFYIDWCPKCQKWKPTLDAINAHFPDMRVHYVNIGDFDSPVARQHNINFVPNFAIVDQRGRRVAEGKAADQWLRRELERRVGRGG